MDVGRSWLKLWTKCNEDMDMVNLSCQDFGRWTRLLLFTKKHGNEGELEIVFPAHVVLSLLEFETLEEMNGSMAWLPGLDIKSDSDDDGVVALKIKFKNWEQYQGSYRFDPTNAIRQSNYRERNKSNVTSNVTDNVIVTQSPSVSVSSSLSSSLNKSKEKKATSFNELFELNNTTKEFLSKENFNQNFIESTHELFLDWARGTKQTYKDWNSTYRNYFRRRVQELLDSGNGHSPYDQVKKQQDTKQTVEEMKRATLERIEKERSSRR